METGGMWFVSSKAGLQLITPTVCVCVCVMMKGSCWLEPPASSPSGPLRARNHGGKEVWMKDSRPGHERPTVLAIKCFSDVNELPDKDSDALGTPQRTCSFMTTSHCQDVEVSGV